MQLGQPLDSSDRKSLGSSVDIEHSIEYKCCCAKSGVAWTSSPQKRRQRRRGAAPRVDRAIKIELASSPSWPLSSSKNHNLSLRNSVTAENASHRFVKREGIRAIRVCNFRMMRSVATTFSAQPPPPPQTATSPIPSLCRRKATSPAHATSRSNRCSAGDTRNSVGAPGVIAAAAAPSASVVPSFQNANHLLAGKISCVKRPLPPSFFLSSPSPSN